MSSGAHRVVVQIITRKKNLSWEEMMMIIIIIIRNTG